jgi:hypothetical protein
MSDLTDVVSEQIEKAKESRLNPDFLAKLLS